MSLRSASTWRLSFFKSVKKTIWELNAISKVLPFQKQMHVNEHIIFIKNLKSIFTYGIVTVTFYSFLKLEWKTVILKLCAVFCFKEVMT